MRGELGAIDTTAPGIQISEKFPGLSRWMRHAAVLRGMSTPEADHDRARIYMHTGYTPGFGGVTYPTLGSTVSAELGDAAGALPNFIVTGAPLTKHDVLRDPGYRGPRHQPLVLSDAGAGLENATPRVEAAEFERRVDLLDHLEQRFATTTRAPAADAHLAGLSAAAFVAGKRSAAPMRRARKSSVDRSPSSISWPRSIGFWASTMNGKSSRPAAVRSGSSINASP